MRNRWRRPPRSDGSPRPLVVAETCCPQELNGVIENERQLRDADPGSPAGLKPHLDPALRGIERARSRSPEAQGSSTHRKVLPLRHQPWLGRGPGSRRSIRLSTGSSSIGSGSAGRATGPARRGGRRPLGPSGGRESGPGPRRVLPARATLSALRPARLNSLSPPELLRQLGDTSAPTFWSLVAGGHRGSWSGTQGQAPTIDHNPGRHPALHDTSLPPSPLLHRRRRVPTCESPISRVLVHFKIVTCSRGFDVTEVTRRRRRSGPLRGTPDRGCRSARELVASPNCDLRKKLRSRSTRSRKEAPRWASIQAGAYDRTHRAGAPIKAPFDRGRARAYTACTI